MSEITVEWVREHVEGMLTTDARARFDALHALKQRGDDIARACLDLADRLAAVERERDEARTMAAYWRAEVAAAELSAQHNVPADPDHEFCPFCGLDGPEGETEWHDDCPWVAAQEVGHD